MESEESALFSSCQDLHPLPMAFHEINTEFSENEVTYSNIKVHHTKNRQKREVTRTLKRKVSSWCIAAVIFAFLYLITLVIAAVMIAKVRCLEGILNETTIETSYCNVMS
ncbi:uncharacterized protein LOC142873415 [Microcebus murinus]|uniref:uncharacterized protein LOC142873415 n=1 Tax=Microcebus murinus TaxID=30608 RepID=UPI003F6C49B4